MILSALVLGSAAFTAQAQNNLYVAGSFNSYSPDVLGSEWALEPVEDAVGMWRGSITVDSPTFDFYVVQNGGRQTIVPGELVVEDGTPHVSPLNAALAVEFDNGYWDGVCAQTTVAAEGKWTVSNWDGGSLEITVDTENNTIVLSASENTPEVGGTGIFLMGAFNDGMDANWELGTTDADNVYRGVFNLPEGDVEFYFNRNGRMDLVPGMEVDVDGIGEVVPAEADVNVAWDETFYSGLFATIGKGNTKWVISNWVGGNIEFTVDVDNSQIHLSALALEEPEGTANLEIAGNFNDYDPAGLEIWSLGYVDKDVYRGTFTLEANNTLEFYISQNGGNQALVPGVVTDGEVEASEENVTITLDNGFYTGSMAQTVGVQPAHWVIENWNGGDIEVTVDFANNEIILSATENDEPIGTADLYIEGNFNDYDAADLEIWNLGFVDTDVYRGTFTIEANNSIEFYISQNHGMQKLVPGIVTDGEVEPSEENVTIELEEGFYSGPMAQTSIGAANWVIENWNGGELEVTVDFANNEIILSVVNEEQPGVTSPFEIAGNFNDYEPNGLEIWGLGYVDTDVYRGTFNIEAGSIDFYISQNGGMQKLVPGIVTDGEVEPSEENVTIELEDGFYSGSLAQTSIGAANWVIENWNGGDLEVTVDLANNEIILSQVNEEPGVTSPFEIAGNFNEYDPQGLEIWNLGYVDTDVYRGTFELEAGNVEFYISQNGGMQALVPGVVTDGDVDPSEENVTIALEDGFYSGALAQTSGVQPAHWVISNWEGGALEVTVDLANNEIILSIANDEPGETSPFEIAGNFNEYDPQGLEIWNLGYVDTDVYRGTFDIPAGNVEFYISQNGGRQALVPGVVTDGEVEASDVDVTIALEDGFYSGALAQTVGLQPAHWVIENWEGGALEVTVDLYNNEIIINVAGEEPIVPAALQIAGNFNDYDPAGLEIWDLGYEGDEIYRGTFDLPAGDVEFFISQNGGMQKLVPGVVTDGEVEPSEENVTVELENGFYSGTLAQTSFGAGNWVIENWEGGALEVTVDMANNTITITTEGYEPAVRTDLYIVGNFNDWASYGMDIWQLNWTGEGEVYSTTTPYLDPREALEFNIEAMGGNMVIVPGAEVDGDVDPMDESVVVVMNNNTFSGLFAQTSISDGQWVIEDWAGGYLQVTIDFATNVVTISVDSTTGVNSINSSDLNNAVIYNLNGVRVDANKLTKGIYIINGKKVLVK